MEVSTPNPYIKIEKVIIDSFKSSVKIKDAKFHHNCSYERTACAITNGILSKNEQAKLFCVILSEEEKLKYIDDYHVNGLDNISLANMEIDFENVGKKEMVYDPYSVKQTDILISSDLKAYRSSVNYANEFLAKNRIEPCNFKAIDVRILKLFEELNNCYEKNGCIASLNQIITRFEQLKEMAQAIIECKLDIPIREMSYEEVTLDIEKLTNSDRFVLTK